MNVIYEYEYTCTNEKTRSLVGLRRRKSDPFDENQNNEVTEHAAEEKYLWYELAENIERLSIETAIRKI